LKAFFVLEEIRYWQEREREREREREGELFAPSFERDNIG
jgi:hypothetical protein